MLLRAATRHTNVAGTVAVAAAKFHAQFREREQKNTDIDWIIEKRKICCFFFSVPHGKEFRLDGSLSEHVKKRALFLANLPRPQMPCCFLRCARNIPIKYGFRSLSSPLSLQFHKKLLSVLAMSA